VTVAVPAAASRRLYEIDARAGVARFLQTTEDAEIRPIGTLLSIGERLVLRVLPDGGDYFVVLDTCDQCGGGFDSDVVPYGRLRFCDDACREQWRFERGETDR
jgi:hypothetical protein